RAAHHGLYVALLPVCNANLPEDHPLVEAPWAAYPYALLLGNPHRKRTHIIWVMGGDPFRKGTDVDNPRRLTLNRAIAEGIADGTNGLDTYDHRAAWSTTLMTYHPRGGGRSSSEHLHREPWLDFHMIQTGPGSDKYFPSFAKVTEDYALQPVKPTLLAEPVYENAYKNSVDRRYDAYDVRQAAYWAVFAGAFGHTYGGLEMWQLLNPGIQRLNRKITTDYWYDLLDLPGAMSLKHLRALLESRPFLHRIPDQSMV
ncbi:MAG: DUF4038 domain-containing protein, partial [bacterium]|nr:DUF4038 domain-containing protein [bacterium]